MTLRLAVLILLLQPHPGAAQNCTPIYQKVYGRTGAGWDEGLDIAKTTDGGSIVAGRTTPASNSTSAFLMKLNEQGSIQWVKSFGGSVFDELKKVKQTPDGGYIAIGSSKSAAQPAGNAWVLRTDANGALLWSRQLISANGPTNGKVLLPLTDGSFAVLLNTNDSTVQSDAILVRLDAAGSLLWSKRFDNGADDGFLSADQDGDELLIGGYTTGDYRDGIIMRLRISDGTPVWVKKVVRDIHAHDEVIGIEKTPNGIALATVIKWPTSGVSGRSPLLVIARLQGDSTVYRLRRYDYKRFDTKYNGLVMFTRDSGLLYVQNDSNTARHGGYMKVGQTGNSEWASTMVNNFPQVYGLYGVDAYDERGYLFTGGYSSFQTGSRLRVQVLKTNEFGRFGSCSPSTQSAFADTVRGFVITTTAWTNVSGAGIDAIGFNPTITSPSFTEATLCQSDNCEPLNTTPNAACYTTFFAQYNTKYRFIPFDVAKVDDGYIISGYSQQHGVEPTVMKVGLNGGIKWVKALNNYIHSGSFQYMRKTDDGNILLAGSDGYVINHGAYDNTVLIKITPDGQVLWSRSLQGSPADLQATENGSFTGLLLYNLTGGTSQVIKYRIDASGNVTYKKCLKSNYEFIPFYRRMLMEGQNMYVAGEINGFVAIDKLDSSGRRLWTQQFKVDDKFCIVESFHEIGDTLYTIIRVPTTVQFTTKDNLVLVKVGKDGGGIKGVVLTNPDLASGATWDYHFWPSTRIDRVTKTADGNFVFADRAVASGDTSLSITKFNPAGQVLWSKKYPALNRHRVVSVEDDGGSLLILGDKRVNDPNFFNLSLNPFLMRTTSSGDIVSDATSTPDCVSQPLPLASAQLTITPLAFPFAAPTPTFQWSEFNEATYTVMERPLNAGMTFGCGLVGDCSLLDVTGPMSVCGRGDTVVYSVRKNAQCVVPVLWRYNASKIEPVRTTDSSITVRFKSYGTATVRAQIQTGCGLLADSIQVSVVASATDVDLGPDTTICPGNTIQLNARKGFASYQWQNGSTDSTYAVTQPGKYFVTVTDACQQTYADTIEVTAHPPIPFDAGSDRSKCNGDTLHFTAPSGFLNYTWSPSYNISSTTQQSVAVNPSVDTVYYVKAEKTPGCFAYDTIRVRVHSSPTINLGSDVSFCSGDSLTLNAGTGFSSYTWNGIAGLQTKTVHTPGEVTVVGSTVEGCKSYDTVRVLNVWTLPTVSLDKNPKLCLGTTRTLSAGTFADYRWQDGSSNATYHVRDVGKYWVHVTDNNGCVGSDTTELTTILPLPSGFLPLDTAICSYGTLLLKSQQPYRDYLWSTSGRSSAITVDRPGTYWLEVVDQNGCKGRDSIVVNPKQCMTGVYIPTAFTPNKDGRNDLFKAMVFGVVKKFELTVYNRWGQVIFYTTDPNRGWDGKISGTEQRTDVFIWTCTYRLEGDTERAQKGTVTIIR